MKIQESWKFVFKTEADRDQVVKTIETYIKHPKSNHDPFCGGIAGRNDPVRHGSVKLTMIDVFHDKEADEIYPYGFFIGGVFDLDTLRDPYRQCTPDWIQHAGVYGVNQMKLMHDMLNKMILDSFATRFKES